MKSGLNVRRVRVCAAGARIVVLTFLLAPELTANSHVSSVICPSDTTWTSPSVWRVDTDEAGEGHRARAFTEAPYWSGVDPV